MTKSLIPVEKASRFYSHWVNGSEKRKERLAELADKPLNELNFNELFKKECNDGFPPARAMHRVRNLLIALIIERDLSDKTNLNEIVTTMSRFADFVIKTHLDLLMREMVKSHGIPIGRHTQKPQEMMVLGMGKLGGGELNVSSDIDLIFLYGEGGETQAEKGQRQLSNHEFFVRLGRRLIAAISDIIEDGFTFRVDMALRPNGASGPLAASLSMLEEYFMVQGREWERYAWIKARAITGNPDDIKEMESIVRPFVFRRYLDFTVIEAIRNMHAQIRAEVTRQEKIHPEQSNNIKLGRGGIREIEFLAQSFQLIRGGRDAALRGKSTRATLSALAEKNLLDKKSVKELLEAYEFLRNLEHRLQYLDDAQTHMLPRSEEEKDIIARAMGFEDTSRFFGETSRRRQTVAEYFDANFSDKTGSENEQNDSVPDLRVISSLPEEERQKAIKTKLQSIGFEDAQAGAKKLEAMWRSPRIANLSENAKEHLAILCRSAILQIVKNSEQNKTLGRLLNFLETIARRSSYLSLLIEYPETLERVIRMMHASEWAAQFLTNHPILLDELLNDLLLKTIPDWDLLAKNLRAQLLEHKGDTESQMNILRETHHANLFLLLAHDLQGGLSMEKLADHLSTLADLIIEASIQTVWEGISNRHTDIPKFAVIAYGKLGGKELGYASDLDLVFLYDDDDQKAPMLYARLAQRFITWMTSHTSAGILFDIDTALRPDGASGMLVSTINAFDQYQKNSAWVWEHQALTRARFCAGDKQIGMRFEEIRNEVICKKRDAETLKKEVLAMRKKMRDANPNNTELFDLKQSPGGMIDVEFIVQYLVLLHSAEHKELTGNLGNIALLRMCDEMELIPKGLGISVGDAYREYRRRQHASRLQGIEDAKINPEELSAQIQCVEKLRNIVFG